MQLKSSRQFRSYVISWFLLIAGLILAIGGIGIYKSAETYLLDSIKHDKLVQINAISALIDSSQHAKITPSQFSSNPLYHQLSEIFAQSMNGDRFKYHIYSLNYQPQKDIFRYAVDPQKAALDSIVVATDQFELTLSRDAAGQLKIIESIDNGQHLILNRGTQIFDIQLVSSSQQWILVVNQKPVLVIKKTVPMSASYKSIVLDSKHLNQQIAVIRLGATETTFSYRFVPQHQSIHAVGQKVIINEKLRTALIAAVSTKNSQSKGGQVLSIADQGIYFYAPLGNSKLVNNGLIVMQISQQNLTKLGEELMRSMFLGFSLLSIFLMSAAIFFARKITHPLEHLSQAIARLIHNDFNFKLSTKGFGSFGFLADQFNLMLTRIQNSRTELIQLNKSYSRFVPHQLLKQLSSSGVTDISLGDSCERQMTVLFCDIRGFTSLSESMSPAANFKFINRYLSQIAPVINQHGGIIDKYMGDGIMALFPNGADEALRAAIEMLQALATYNETLIQKNLPTISIGVGLHSGRTMLGTVGTPLRMDATVISDTVNAAARVESMTKAFCTQILITEETKRQLKDLAKYRLRYIASCQIQGKSKPVTLYEVFNNDPLSLQTEKARNQSMMIQAWKTYLDGDGTKAVQMYQRLIEMSPNDKALFAMIERCQSGRL